MSTSPSDSSTPTIGKSIVLKGDLTGDEDLRIDGQIEGGIQLAQHELTIGESGRAQAELYARCVIVLGHVTGNITASESVEIHATGIVEGNVHAPRLSIADGAVLNGSVQMSEASRSPSPGTPGTSSAPARGEDSPGS